LDDDDDDDENNDMKIMMIKIMMMKIMMKIMMLMKTYCASETGMARIQVLRREMTY
jgi:hypothetical protein